LGMPTQPTRPIRAGQRTPARAPPSAQRFPSIRCAKPTRQRPVRIRRKWRPEAARRARQRRGRWIHAAPTPGDRGSRGANVFESQPLTALQTRRGWHRIGTCTRVAMLVFCAWCRHEQKVGYLGMREPLENPVVTHGVCREHQQRLLESFPSRSFPGVELLIIVRRHGTTLYESLERAYAATPRVKVLMDRRVGERRSASREVVIEHRGRSTRRIRRGTVSVLGGFMTVRFTPKRIAPPPPEIYSQ